LTYAPPHQESLHYRPEDWPRTIWAPEFLDFRNVLYVIWRSILFVDPTPLQYDIAHYLQYGPDPDIAPNAAPNNRTLVEAQRGEGKSWIGGAFACWFLGLDPHEHEVLVVSAGKDKADDFSTFAHRIIQEIDIFKPLLPNDAQRWSMVNFDVAGHRASQVASCRSKGIYSQITGGRADLIIADDIEVPNTAETPLQREKLRHRRTEFEWILKPGGRELTLGTPHVEDTIYNTLDAWKRLWPARYPHQEWLDKYGEYLSPFLQEHLDDDPSIEGTPTDPGRFTEVDLMEREAASGKSHFALQMMLDTRPADSEKRPLKTKDLLISPVDPEVGPGKLVWAPGPETIIRDQSKAEGLPSLAPDGDRFYRPLEVILQDQEKIPRYPYESSILAVDPAGRGGDEISWCVLHSLHGNLFCPMLKGKPGGYEEANLKEIGDDARRHKVTLVLAEDNFGDGMFAQLLRPHLRGIRVEDVKQHRQKELRIIDTLEPLMNQHRLVIDPRVILWDYDNIQKYPGAREQYSLIHQLTRITRDKGSLRHDDRLDVLAIACAHFLEAVARTADESLEISKSREMDDEIREFLELFDGPQGNTWGSRNAGLRSRR
jgi:hypothetical protein